MGLFNVDINGKFKEIITRSAGEKHEDFRISDDIKNEIDRIAKETGIRITEDDIINALNTTVWAPFGNPFSEGIEGVSASEGSGSIDSKLEAVRQQKIALSAANSGNSPAAFGDLASAVSTHQSGSGGTSSQVNTIINSTQKANADAQENVREAQKKLMI